MNIIVLFHKTTKKGIESSLVKEPKQVTLDRRCSFSYLQKEDGTVHVYAGTLAKCDRNSERVRELKEMVAELLNEGK